MSIGECREPPRDATGVPQPTLNPPDMGVVGQRVVRDHDPVAPQQGQHDGPTQQYTDEHPTLDPPRSARRRTSGTQQTVNHASITSERFTPTVALTAAARASLPAA